MIKEVTKTTTEITCDFCQKPSVARGTCRICDKDFCIKHGLDLISNPFKLNESDDDYYEFTSSLCSDCYKLLNPFKERAYKIQDECLEKLAEVEQEWRDLKDKLLEKHGS